MSAQRDGLLKRCDCAPEQWRKCEHPWHLKLRHDGTRFSVSLDVYAKRRGLELPRQRGEAETLAERIAREIRSSAYEERPTPTPSPGPPVTTGDAEALTFEQAAARFVMERLVPKDLASLGDEKGRYRRLNDTLLPGVGRVGSTALDALNEDRVEALYALVTEGLANHTKRKYRRALKRLFKWAGRKQLVVENPITDETVLHVGTGVMRMRRVRPGEEHDLVEAAGEARSDAAWRLVGLIVAALDLGARLGELLALQWRDILFDDGRVSIRAVEAGARKNRKPRQVPLTPRLVALLGTLEAAAPTSKGWLDTDYVFGDAIGGKVTKIRKAWVTCVLRAHKVEAVWTGTGALGEKCQRRFQAIDLHFHDLRHECALRWLERGYKLNTIAVLLGHSNLDTLRVYLGVAGEDALEEAERLNATQPAAASLTMRGRDGSRVTIRPEPGQPAPNRHQIGRTPVLRVVKKREVETG